MGSKRGCYDSIPADGDSFSSSSGSQRRDEERSAYSHSLQDNNKTRTTTSTSIMFPHWRRSRLIVGFVFAVLATTFAVVFLVADDADDFWLRGGRNGESTTTISLLAQTHDDDSSYYQPDKATKRCDYVIDLFESKNAGASYEQKRESFAKQAENANVFYRATAELFWLDFKHNNWDDEILQLFVKNYKQDDDGNKNSDSDDGRMIIDDKATWTWVTGDQHLSNFGAWRNRNNKVVFSVNDFDEAAIADFHVDVLRCAVSIYNHATTNGLSTSKTSSKKKKKKKKHGDEDDITRLLRAFTDTYIDTVIGYDGNEDALTFELTVDTAKGFLKDFLHDVENDNSHKSQLKKYTDMNGTFLRNNETRLVSVLPQIETMIRMAFTSQQYGATMMKTGWRVPKWQDEYFEVLDIAQRLGSGVGSYGVDRYYVLLNGTGGGHGDGNIILDVKYEPKPAVSKVLNDDDTAWYEVLFRNEANRAVEAQRRLTSYTDPFTGWAMINGNAFVVRQKSPWKDSPDLEELTSLDDFEGFVEMVAIATATSHTRGTRAKAPGEFKHVIAQIFETNQSAKKKIWGKAVERIAEMYHQQVLLDYKCFKDHVNANYTKF